MQPSRLGVLTLTLATCTVSVAGQSPPPPRGDERTSWTLDTFTPGPCSPTGARHGGCNPGELVRISVTTIASGLVQPWHITFLPGTSDALVTELPGRLRIIRNGALDPTPVPGWPSPSIPSRSLHSVALHPRFAENRTVYLTYVKGKDAETARRRRSLSRAPLSTARRCPTSSRSSRPTPGAAAPRPRARSSAPMGCCTWRWACETAATAATT